MKQSMPPSTLAYFREHLPSEEEEVHIEQPSEAILAFAQATLEVVGATLARFGFIRKHTRLDATGVTLTYRRDLQWVRVDASTDFRDSPAYFNLILGVDGPGASMAVALWRVMRLEPGLEEAGEYTFPVGGGVGLALRNAVHDLERHGEGFLEGDFGKVREAWGQLLKDTNH